MILADSSSLLVLISNQFLLVIVNLCILYTPLKNCQF